MNKQHYDLISIGGGSGGLAVAERAAMLGANTAIIDPQRLGGTCVNNGCVPKKVMWYAAELAHAVDEARGFGIPARSAVCMRASRTSMGPHSGWASSKSATAPPTRGVEREVPLAGP